MIGLAALTGWALDIPALKAVLPGATTMKANTAACVAAVAVGLLSLPDDAANTGASWRRPLVLAAGGWAALVGALTVIEYVSGVTLGIDQLLFADPNTTSPPYPGRMAPEAAVGFACLGSAVVLLGRATYRPDIHGWHCAFAGHLLALPPAVSGYLSLSAYAYGVEDLHMYGPYVALALNSAAAFLLLAGAVWLTLPDRGWRHGFAGRPVALGVLARLLPFSLALPFATGAAVIWGARAHIYDPLYGPALLAAAAAVLAAGLAWFASAAVRRAEAELASSEARFRNLVEAMPQMAFVNRPDGYAEFQNRRWTDYTGIPQGDEIRKRWPEAVHPDDRQRTLLAWNAALASGEPYVIEHRLRDFRGEFRWFLTRAVPMREAETGHIQHWLGTATDISDIVAAREAIARSHDELERIVAERTRALQETQARLAHAQRLEALGQLAGGIAHDFNNVVQAIQGATALIEEKTGDAERVRGLVRIVKAAAGRAAAITGRLLAFARRSELRAEPIAPAPLLAGMQEILAHTLGCGISVQVEAPADLPPLLADKSQLETVLINLATNGRDAMQGSGVLRLAASLDERGSEPEGGLKPGRYIRLSVSDTGGGMTPDVLARAVEPFFTTKQVGHGTGLGLAMARGFAEQSAGALAIDSVVGRGTVVSLWFPVAEEESSPACTADEGGADAGVAGRRGGVLLVDDDELVRETLADHMERRGYAVLAAGGGSAALALMDGGAVVDLLVTDMSMPEMDGLALIREAQRRRPGLPAILLTGGFTTRAAEAAMNGDMAGCCTVLRKPISSPVLAERAAALLDGAAAAQDGMART